MTSKGTAKYVLPFALPFALAAIVLTQSACVSVTLERGEIEKYLLRQQPEQALAMLENQKTRIETRASTCSTRVCYCACKTDLKTAIALSKRLKR